VISKYKISREGVYGSVQYNYCLFVNFVIVRLFRIMSSIFSFNVSTCTQAFYHRLQNKNGPQSLTNGHETVKNVLANDQERWRLATNSRKRTQNGHVHISKAKGR
jgi:hypothetical protein